MTEPIDIQLKKGVLELCVLELLAQEDGYAYDIASRLAEAIGMGEGTVYPLMRRLHTEGLVETYFVESSSRTVAQVLPHHARRPRGAHARTHCVARVHACGEWHRRRSQVSARAEFLATLRAGLRGAPAGSIEEIVVDYAAHFDRRRRGKPRRSGNRGRAG